jgi:3,4-dihydroxy 2-butanone 4-phosphate synthase/GTP cyclohydrolase II
LGLPADGRNYAVACEILNELGIAAVDLLTNNPEKVAQLERHGILVAKRSPLIVGVNEQNRMYLTTKGERMGHLIDKDDL